jgi:N-acetylglutamate synthase-like GNAT family acetyltransferase
VSSPVTIRRYDEQDSAACRSLWAELTRWHRALYDDPSLGGDDPGSGFDRYREDYAAARLWIAERKGSVVGLIGLIIRGKQAELEPVVVSFDVRGQGVGRSLVETALEAAQAEGVVQIKVSPVARNATALRFFHELGFDTLGHVDLLLDLERPKKYWRERERLGEREFRA